jgi:hypothetical protein
MPKNCKGCVRYKLLTIYQYAQNCQPDGWHFFVQRFAMQNTKINFRRGCFHKYKSLEGINFDQALELIETLAIYCPKPSELNDDDEFRPTFSVAQLSDAGLEA